MSGPGINRLARVLDSRTQKHIGANSSVNAEFATLQSDMSLLCDHFGYAFKPGEYSMVKSVSTGLQSGDRVLVNWVNGGTIPVIIDKVVSSSG